MDSINNAIPTPPSWFSHNIGVTVLSLAILWFAFRVIYNLAFSPLSSIPGPWYAAISNFWITTHVLRLQQCKTVQRLFEDYGPVVRIAPNKVVFRDITTMRSVYLVHKFDKSTFYKSLLTNDNDHAMTTLDHAQYAVRRKGYAPHYIPANLALFQPEARDFTLELVHGLEQMPSKQPLDCLTLFRHFMVDVIVSSSYGYRLGALSKWIVGAEDPLSTAIGDFPKRGTLRSACPTWAWNFICRIPNNRWRQMCDSDKIMAEFVSARVYETRAQISSGKIGESEKAPMLHRLLDYKYTSNEAMPDQDIISEAMGHMIAGTDTMSISLSYFLWELSRRTDVMRKLQAELDQAIPDSHAIPDISVLQRLPYLNAFVKEGLRLYGAAPSALERVVPPSTSKNGATNEAFDLMGYALPPGTIVSTQGWSMHRDASIFPSPETFLPDRWLETSGNSEQLAQMAQYLIPFGMGSRACGGQNLAQMMLRITIAALARNFDIIAPPETNERSMEIKDSFVIFPVSMECRLAFQPRKQ
ncbi:hypothetical protein SERLA73DRAFT_178240 [Serpula lacrymans var. lacrymans S7.3]|uniref:Cytochrome P450 n=2 Tax=Serpula lacrymans var. lacrymans TaxID=341189 RepID=F8PR53_SERL3|nr:uncharacterized protein SERLADRAFT_462553 [Serpula lacrymans var. lacrymans S7.9]EGO02344.1 hypothetical protein SERLA73DRAFT_178240 [Serpula lacrymans var. lacrymans S7.3]EGO28078.1 hypothetical protein SERLADRAFT_462553 [Serpula lacrymans var. lacrymans S7.9]